jgi:hypothetical protein
MELCVVNSGMKVVFATIRLVYDLIEWLERCPMFTGNGSRFQKMELPANMPVNMPPPYLALGSNSSNEFNRVEQMDLDGTMSDTMSGTMSDTMSGTMSGTTRYLTERSDSNEFRVWFRRRQSSIQPTVEEEKQEAGTSRTVLDKFRNFKSGRKGAVIKKLVVEGAIGGFSNVLSMVPSVGSSLEKAFDQAVKGYKTYRSLHEIDAEVESLEDMFNLLSGVVGNFACRNGVRFVQFFEELLKSLQEAGNFFDTRLRCIKMEKVFNATSDAAQIDTFKTKFNELILKFNTLLNIQESEKNEQSRDAVSDLLVTRTASSSRVVIFHAKPREVDQIGFNRATRKVVMLVNPAVNGAVEQANYAMSINNANRWCVSIVEDWDKELLYNKHFVPTATEVWVVTHFSEDGGVLLPGGGGGGGNKDYLESLNSWMTKLCACRETTLPLSLVVLSGCNGRHQAEKLLDNNFAEAVHFWDTRCRSNGVTAYSQYFYEHVPTVISIDNQESVNGLRLAHNNAIHFVQSSRFRHTSNEVLYDSQRFICGDPRTHNRTRPTAIGIPRFLLKVNRISPDSTTQLGHTREVWIIVEVFATIMQIVGGVTIIVLVMTPIGMTLGAGAVVITGMSTCIATVAKKKAEPEETPSEPSTLRTAVTWLFYGGLVVGATAAIVLTGGACLGFTPLLYASGAAAVLVGSTTVVAVAVSVKLLLNRPGESGSSVVSVV